MTILSAYCGLKICIQLRTELICRAHNHVNIFNSINNLGAYCFGKDWFLVAIVVFSALLWLRYWMKLIKMTKINDVKCVRLNKLRVWITFEKRSKNNAVKNDVNSARWTEFLQTNCDSWRRPAIVRLFLLRETRRRRRRQRRWISVRQIIGNKFTLKERIFSLLFQLRRFRHPKIVPN